ncbi:MAG: hypothetical protein J6P46_08025 [Bacteroidales bacterium]|nr:hypothetical protein [Bacteroidales bacterium]
MNKKQKMQVTLAVLFAILLIFWLLQPGWERGKWLGLLSNALGLLAMLLSYRAEEKNKQ